MKSFSQTVPISDPYTSRASTTPSILDRQDPVIYDPEKNGPLSQAELDHYEEKGFLFFDALFDDKEIAFLLQEIEHLKTHNKKVPADYIIREPEEHDIRSFFYVHTFHSAFQALTQDSRLVARAEQILGSAVYLHQSRINLKPAFKGKEFYWHSDFETWHVEDGMPRMRALSCSIALTDNNAFNGSLMIIPGSHNHYISCVGHTPEEHHLTSLRKQEYGIPDKKILQELVETYGITAPKGKTGSVLFFDCNLMHGSNSNITPWPRTNAFIVYNSVHNTLVRPYSGMAPRPQYIANREDYSPVKASSDTFSNGRKRVFPSSLT